MSELKQILNLTYAHRHSINAIYSRNAFARNLGISPTALSQYLSGKRKLSPKNVERVINSLNLPREFVQKEKEGSPRLDKAQRLSLDRFSFISDWSHFAILNLIEIEKITNLNQVAKRLGIHKKVAKSAVERLEKLEFLRFENGFYVRQVSSLNVGEEIPSQAIRKHNREKMELAILAMENVALSLRDISSLTLTFDTKNMAKVKKEIHRFKDRILKYSKTEEAHSVYSLNVQFFPLTK